MPAAPFSSWRLEKVLEAGRDHRYVVERTLASFGHCRRIKLCYEKTGEHFRAFHDLAASLICADVEPE